MPSPPRSFASFPTHADLFYVCTSEEGLSDEDLSLHYAPPSRSSLRIGVVVLGHEQIQLLDLATFDLLAMLGRNRLAKMHASSIALDEAMDEIDIRYVSMTGEGSFGVTSGSRMPVTPSESQSGGEVKNSFDNAPLFDILIIPGSFSTTELPVSALSFFARQCCNPNLIAIMSIASGIAHLVQTGLLHKTRAAAPRCLLSTLRQHYPETFWQHSSWSRQDKMWSSSSTVSALDMIATWMREYLWDRQEAVECVLNAAGIGLQDDYNHCDY